LSKRKILTNVNVEDVLLGLLAIILAAVAWFIFAMLLPFIIIAFVAYLIYRYLKGKPLQIGIPVWKISVPVGTSTTVVRGNLCTKCGSVNNDKSMYCGKCGARLH